ncbi:DUF1796 family putative cysteine peptidase [Fictibacillus arsenicus]|uniref:Peptidase n=1 Tax=Fictibacillus arsenicus TaxID=255247 RepID=A0A1V3G7Y5_9BACL|nr:DUF1796 family putative cysteine peptidase [Fictibacillus arsenicus]OOE12510.1 hypothetical protein UN64_10525 [Fictibacillus arsenicus]
MKLTEIQKPYHMIISLGSECGPALHLRRHHLRRTSLPFDWVCSHSLSGINRLIQTKFNGYMELHNMIKIESYKPGFVLDEAGQNTGSHSHFIKDTQFNVISVHDFPIVSGQDWKTTYPSYKQKLNQRIERFYNCLNQSPSILFIRWSLLKIEENQIKNETSELERVLSNVVKGEFKILMIHPKHGVNGITNVEWGLKNVCAVHVPYHSEPITDNTIWNHLLKGISIK